MRSYDIVYSTLDPYLQIEVLENYSNSYKMKVTGPVGIVRAFCNQYEKDYNPFAYNMIIREVESDDVNSSVVITRARSCD